MHRPSQFLYNQATLIDTSAAIAFLDVRERYHPNAKLFFEEQQNVAWASVDVTAHEAFTRARYDGDYPRAAQAFDFLRSIPIKFIPFEPDDEKQALGLLKKYSDHKISFHDALCAAIMRRLGIYRIFSFDKDFLVLGFEVLPGIFR